MRHLRKPKTVTKTRRRNKLNLAVYLAKCLALVRHHCLEIQPKRSHFKTKLTHLMMSKKLRLVKQPQTHQSPYLELKRSLKTLSHQLGEKLPKVLISRKVCLTKNLQLVEAACSEVSQAVAEAVCLQTSLQMVVSHCLSNETQALMPSGLKPLASPRHLLLPRA